MQLSLTVTLFPFYTHNGFEPVSWTRFDKDYAPHDWVEGRDAEEEVVFYKYTGNTASVSYDDFLDSTNESSNYETAKAKRNGEME